MFAQRGRSFTILVELGILPANGSGLALNKHYI
jgi:hypothetical protein